MADAAFIRKHLSELRFGKKVTVLRNHRDPEAERWGVRVIAGPAFFFNFSTKRFVFAMDMANQGETWFWIDSLDAAITVAVAAEKMLKEAGIEALRKNSEAIS